MSLNDYEETIKSFIHDDDKLVTYKWLSKELEVHVNVTKDILKLYWEKHKNKTNISATFLLIGQLQDKSIHVEVVKDIDLDTAKEKFVKLDCEHIYSLQKYLSDIELLASAGEGDLRFSAIKCNKELIRSDEEIESLRYIGNEKKEGSKIILTIDHCNKDEIAKSNSSFKQISNLGTEKITDKKTKNNDKKTDINSQQSGKGNQGKKETSPVKNNANSAKSKKEIQEKKESPSEKSNANSTKSTGKSSKKPIQSTQSGFNNLFGKVPNKSQVSTKNSQTKSKEETQNSTVKEKKSKEKENMKQDQIECKGNVKENKTCHDSEEKVRNKVKVNNNKEVEKSKPVTVKKSRGLKRNRSQENNATSKRKRIVIMDSSDEGSDKSNEDEEQEQEPMQIEEEPPKVIRKRSPSPPSEKRENGKRMIRKTVNKTFKDEEGYLVTKQVYIYEAISDNEEPLDAKNKEVEKVKKVKPVENKTKKQTKLINFFKKS